jgi:hypothetical protein
VYFPDGGWFVPAASEVAIAACLAGVARLEPARALCALIKGCRYEYDNELKAAHSLTCTLCQFQLQQFQLFDIFGVQFHVVIIVIRTIFEYVVDYLYLAFNPAFKSPFLSIQASTGKTGAPAALQKPHTRKQTTTDYKSCTVAHSLVEGVHA